MSNYYDLLGIAKTATLQQIKSAYKKQALKYHPDRNAANPQEAKLAEERFKLINEAYQVLSDPVKKSRYDNQLEFEHARRQEYYKQYTSTGYSQSNQSSYGQTNQNYQSKQRRDTKKQPTFVFGKTEMYIVLGFAVMTVFAYFLMNIMSSIAYSSYMTEAKEAIEAKDFVTAVKALDEADGQKEKDAEVNYLLGIIEADYKQDYADAIECFEKAIKYADLEEKQQRAKYYIKKGDTYLLMNEYYKAVQEYKNAGSVGEYDQITIMKIAELYLYKLKDYDKASLYFDKVIDKEPTLIDPYIGKAAAKLQAKDYAAMEKTLNKAIEIDSENPFLWYYKGFYFWGKPTKKNQDKTKDKENACESWKIAARYGSEEAQKPLGEYCN